MANWFYEVVISGTSGSLPKHWSGKHEKKSAIIELELWPKRKKMSGEGNTICPPLMGGFLFCIYVII